MDRPIEWGYFQFDKTQDGNHDMTGHKLSTTAELCRLLPNYFGPLFYIVYAAPHWFNYLAYYNEDAEGANES